MSHEFESGAFRRPAWHQLGETFTNSRDVDQCVSEAGMDYTIEKKPSQVLVDSDMPGYHKTVEVPGQYHLVRSTDNKIVSPQTVRNKYTVLQPSTQIDVLREYVDQGWATVDGIFSLYDGGSDVVCLQLDAQQSVTGDESEYQHYMVVQNFHGRGACRGKLVSFRVVCHNTATAAFGSKGVLSDWKIPHTASIGDRYKVACRTWENVKAQITEQAKILGLFAEHELDVPKCISDILGIDEDSSTRAINQRDLILSYADLDANNVGDNALTVYNSFTGWATHHAGGKAGKEVTSRLESQFSGDRGKKEQLAADHLMQLVATSS